MMPSASAASVPGSSAMCSWHFSAVALRYGSIAISFAPRRFASCARVQKCRFDVTGLLPQIRISLLSTYSSTSMPIDAPMTAAHPALPAAAQIVRSSSDAPRRWKKRRSIDAALQQAHRAGVAVRQDRLRPVGRSGDRPKALARSRRAPRPRDAREAAFALCADAPHRIAAAGRANRCARDSARPSCTACRRSSDDRARRGSRSARPFSTVTSIAHVSGQSCGQARAHDATRSGGRSCRAAWHARIIVRDCAARGRRLSLAAHGRCMSQLPIADGPSGGRNASVPALGLGTWHMGERRDRRSAGSRGAAGGHRRSA